jgi:3',5'-cyclic AMP phosphodiesterase CpdA
MTAGRMVKVLSLVVAVAVLAAVLRYRDPAWRYVTHLKGSPTHTTAYAAPSLVDPPLLRIAAPGDIGDSGSRLNETAAAIDRLTGARGWDVLWLLGDNVYPNGDPARIPDTVFAPFAPVLDRGTRLLAIVGNHDVKEGHGPAQMKALGMPGLWWSTTIGDVLLVGLDSNTPDDPKQRAWLEATLARSDARWKIVSLHQSPYSAGYQGSSMAARRSFTPIFRRYGVQLVLSGHDHDYQRSKPLGGVTYIVSGAAAGSRRTSERSFTAVSFSWHHFVELDVYADRIVGRAVNQAGRVADEWTIRDGRSDSSSPGR